MNKLDGGFFICVLVGFAIFVMVLFWPNLGEKSKIEKAFEVWKAHNEHSEMTFKDWQLLRSTNSL